MSTFFLIFSDWFSEKEEVKFFDLVIARTAGQWIVVDNITYRLCGPQNASCCGAVFSYWLVVTRDAVRLSTGLQYVHGLSRKFFFLLAGHKVDFIAPCGAKKSTFWRASRKKIVCNTRKTFILLVWLLPSLCSGIKLHTRKINFFFPSCTMYYFITSARAKFCNSLVTVLANFGILLAL